MMVVMKRLSLIAGLLLLAAVSTAQESRAQRFERIEAEKIAFITKELNLTPTEAQKFFPIYNQYSREISRLKQERRSEQRPLQQPLKDQRVPPASLKPSGRDILAFDAKELELKKIYRKRFAEVIGQARASRFFEAEEEFRNYLIRELQHRRRDKDED